MKLRPRRKNMILLCSMALFVLFCFWVIVVLVPETEYPVYQLSEHWNAVLADGSTQTDVRLVDVNFGSVHTGDVYELQHMLPPEEVLAGTVQIRTRHSSIEVYVDDEMIYADGMQYPEEGLMTPSPFHFIPLPEGYAGRVLKLRIWGNEESAFSGLEPVTVGNIYDLEIEYLRATRLTLFVGLFLCVMGIILFFIFIYLSVNYRTEPRILFSGLMSLLIGLYMLCFYSLTGFLSPGELRNNLMEYITLLLIPCSFMALLSSANERKSRIVYGIVAVLDLLVAAVIIGLHYKRTIFIDQYIFVAHLMVLLEGFGIIIYTAISSWLSRRRSLMRQEWRVSQIVWAAGFFSLLIASMVDIFRFNYSLYMGGGNESYANLNALTIGSLLFVSSLIVNFFLYHIEQLYEDATIRRLSGLAYTDPLTDMANRSRCEQLMRRVDDDGQPFVVISMDLDHLKEINDKYGHTAGDQYLSDMAKLLRQSFLDTVLLGRMGGDEFIAIWNGTDLTPCKRSVARMETALINRHYTHPPVRGDISYGYAVSTETYSGTVKDTFHLADARMYELKTFRHQQEATHA